MTDILKELYENENLFRMMPVSDTYKALCEKDAQSWAKLEPILGADTLDELSDITALVKDQSNFEWFRWGFRLGASLMLELLD